MARLFLVVALIMGIVAGPALAGDAEIAALKAVFSPGPVDTSLFDAAFLKAVPPDKVEAGIGPLKTLMGPVLSIEAKGGPSYLIETATYEIGASISLDATGKIAGLVFQEPKRKNASIDDLLKQMAAVAPQSAWLVTKNGATLYSSNPEMALGVGSAFKLGVLKALKDEIDAGTHRWDEVVHLKDADKSLPSGLLQSWPDGSALTLHTLAALMMSISDNTAADTLLKLAGRDKVEAALGVAPVLTTRELFVLKGNPDLMERYKSGDLDTRRKVLAEAATRPLPDVSKALAPQTPGVEWDVSPTKLCALIAEVGELDVTQINPGVADKTEWKSVSFKGGSETGVLSLTTLAVSKSGDTYCASAVWNGPQAIEEAVVFAAYGGLLDKLSKL
jgi:beta-lactamase class A